MCPIDGKGVHGKSKNLLSGEGTGRQGDKETRRQGYKDTMRQRDKGTREQRKYENKRMKRAFW